MKKEKTTVKKERKSRKKFWLVMLALVCAVALVFGINALLKEIFWAVDPKEITLDLSRYQDEFEEADAIYAEVCRVTDEQFHLYQTELTEAELKQVRWYQDAVVDYYQDVYGVDVSERIYSVSVYKEDFSFLMDKFGFSAGGYYDSDRHMILLADYHFEDYSLHFANNLTHELVHASGVVDDENAEFISEGFTEVVTEQVLDHAGVEYMNYSYLSNTAVANQLFAIDPEIVRYYVTDPEFSVLDRIDELAGAEVAEDLELACYLYNNGGDRDTMEFYMQHCVAEILKRHTEDARDLAEQYPVDVMFFGIRSLFEMF